MKLYKTLIKEKFKLNIYYSDETVIFLFNELEGTDIKIYRLLISREELYKKNEDFLLFKNTDKLIHVIKTCIESNNYSVKIEKNNFLIFEIKDLLFNNGSIKIQIPEFSDLYPEEENFTKIKLKEESAINSFKGGNILEDNEKILISKWIHPTKVIKFNLLYSTNDSNDSGTFHYYCDGNSPTVVIVREQSSYNMKFGGYSTNTWQAPYGTSTLCRAPDSFLFNLTKKEKYNLIDPLCQKAIYKNNSYGPVFGNSSSADLFLYNGSTSCCQKVSYDTGNNNLLGRSGKTSFNYSVYEVYQVIFD